MSAGKPGGRTALTSQPPRPQGQLQTPAPSERASERAGGRQAWGSVPSGAAWPWRRAAGHGAGAATPSGFASQTVGRARTLPAAAGQLPVGAAPSSASGGCTTAGHGRQGLPRPPPASCSAPHAQLRSPSPSPKAAGMLGPRPSHQCMQGYPGSGSGYPACPAVPCAALPARGGRASGRGAEQGQRRIAGGRCGICTRLGHQTAFQTITRGCSNLSVLPAGFIPLIHLRAWPGICSS